MSFTRQEQSAAYDAGYDCGKNGANAENCDPRYFSCEELTRAWERGRANGEEDSDWETW